MKIKRSYDETNCDECMADKTREGDVLPADVFIELDNGFRSNHLIYVLLMLEW
jgi:hypothetical protein